MACATVIGHGVMPARAVVLDDEILHVSPLQVYMLPYL